VNLSLPAAPAGSGSVGAAACGDIWTLLRPGGASAFCLVGAVVMAGDACMSPAGWLSGLQEGCLPSIFASCPSAAGALRLRPALLSHLSSWWGCFQLKLGLY